MISAIDNTNIRFFTLGFWQKSIERTLIIINETLISTYTYTLWLYLLYLLYLLFSLTTIFCLSSKLIQQIQLQNVSVTNFIATLLTPYGCICCTCCICCFPHYNILSFLTTSECHSYQLHHNLLKPCDRFLII